MFDYQESSIQVDKVTSSWVQFHAPRFKNNFLQSLFIQDKENQNDLFLLERENQFVWESIGQIKLFEIEKEANKTNGQILQTITKKLT